MYSRNAADAGAYCHRVVLSWALFPAMVATGTDRIFANLFWMGVMIRTSLAVSALRIMRYCLENLE